ncbi:MAG: hypothetical protein KJS97_05840 [Alphaproteobacteria bacterium]|nr:hypothetical protein [Alphaproteobacteria bacterium]
MPIPFEPSLDLIITLSAIALLGALFAFASHRAAQPADPLNPRLVPWRPIIVISGFATLVAIVHLLNLAGVETGRP